MEELSPRIVVVGVGGAGGNAVANMIRSNVSGVEFVVANTDAQALRASSADRILQLGRRTTEGLGAGSRAEVGAAAAEESFAEIERILEGANMCFIAAGLGGGTGTGAAPVIARAAKAMGILTVGVVTKPFGFEGERRARAAEAGLQALQQQVDSLIIIPNQNLFRIASPNTTFKQAFDLADEVLQQGVRGVTDLMTMPGFINLDFADVRTVMAEMGRAMMGTGEAGGDDRALRAAEAAIANPLLDESLNGARGLLISISGGQDMRLMEVDEAANHIRGLVDPEADIIWGSSFNPELEGRIRVSVVATGINGEAAAAAPAVDAALLRKIVEKAPARALVRDAKPAPASTRPAVSPAPVAVARVRPASEPVPAPKIVLTPPEIEIPEPATSAYFDEAVQLEPVEELLLGADRLLRPVPPSPPQPRAPGAIAEAMRGPSLFERMAMAARGAVVQRGREVDPVTARRGPVFLDRRHAA
ncbi:cell division protein FtsZ [Sphingosinicella terrae]|uniref:cell division protein FtsZ n=1 Tax=Sphingosinicella terrae TaxID=2172047 RepID=UPI002548F4B5|nr:cell division protein FtsZ [Sphingosinicella terrae]